MDDVLCCAIRLVRLVTAMRSPATLVDERGVGVVGHLPDGEKRSGTFFHGRGAPVSLRLSCVTERVVSGRTLSTRVSWGKSRPERRLVWPTWSRVLMAKMTSPRSRWKALRKSRWKARRDTSCRCRQIQASDGGSAISRSRRRRTRYPECHLLRGAAVVDGERFRYRAARWRPDGHQFSQRWFARARWTIMSCGCRRRRVETKNESRQPDEGRGDTSLSHGVRVTMTVSIPRSILPLVARSAM